MISPLRVVHHAAWMSLALVLPMIIAAALAARNPVAPESHPASLAGAKQGSRLGIFYIRCEGNVVFVVAANRFEYPDALAYWSPDSESVSDKSKLLGSFIPGSVNRYEKPPEPGYLVLFTPARKTVIDSAPLGGVE